MFLSQERVSVGLELCSQVIMIHVSIDCLLYRQLELSVQLQKNVSQRTQLQLMCYQWLYEDILMSAGHQPNSGPRATLMTDLKKVK